MKKRVAILYPEIGYAGTDAVVVSILEALKDSYDVNLITTTEPNLKSLNDFFGTNLDSRIKIKTFPFFKHLKNSTCLRLLKLHLLMRYCKINQKKYDLFLSAYGEMDFGTTGIQYVHFPDIDCEAKIVINRSFYRKSLSRKAYQLICRIISGYSLNRIKENLTLANSFWTKKIVDKTYNISSKVVYPPVLNDFNETDWQNKENGFVFIGRISPDKRPFEVIKILEKVRKRGLNIHVHILGNTGLDQEYIKKVERAAKENSSWIFYDGKVTREKLTSIVSSHKYGISGKKFEHFGIAIAEMVKAGCITFVNNDGGQVDIVNQEELLIYNSDEEAVEKIIHILENEDQQRNVRKMLKVQSKKYSKENFISEINASVEDFFKNQP
jgi:glycosyltransferase involved in cell wall biosynthesis